MEGGRQGGRLRDDLEEVYGREKEETKAERAHEFGNMRWGEPGENVCVFELWCGTRVMETVWGGTCVRGRQCVHERKREAADGVLQSFFERSFATPILILFSHVPRVPMHTRLLSCRISPDISTSSSSSSSGICRSSSSKVVFGWGGCMRRENRRFVFVAGALFVFLM